MRVDEVDINSFLAFDCGLINSIDREVLSNKEYQLLVEGKRRQIESQQIRDRANHFYMIAPHRGKDTIYKKPSDLYPITATEIAQFINGNKLSKKQRFKQDAMQRYCEENNITFA